MTDSLSERFEALEDAINGAEPTVERCRDWAQMLANLCSELAARFEAIGEKS